MKGPPSLVPYIGDVQLPLPCATTATATATNTPVLNSHHPGASFERILLEVVDIDAISEANLTAKRDLLIRHRFQGIILTYSVQSRSSFAEVRHVLQAIQGVPDLEQHAEVDPGPADYLSPGVQGNEIMRRIEKAAMEETEAGKAVINSKPEPRLLPVYLLGTKADDALQEEPEGMVALRQVFFSEGQALAEELGCVGFCECSAKDDRGCEVPFNEMARIIVEQERREEMRIPKPKPVIVEKRQGNGCFGGRLGRMFCR